MKMVIDLTRQTKMLVVLFLNRNFWTGLILLFLSSSASALLVTSPTSGSSVVVGNTITFVAFSQDALCGSYTWNFGGAATDVTIPDVTEGGNDDISTTVTLNTTGTFTIVLSASGGCESTPNPVTLLLNVNANVNPTATIDIPSSSQIIQVGQSVSFSGTGSDSDSSGGLSYSWDFNGGATNSTAEDPGAITFSTTGTYTVSFTVIDSDGGSSTDTETIKVNAAPTAAIDTPSTATSIQIGSAVSFTGTGTDSDSSGGLTYAWNFGGGATNSSLEDPGGVTFSTAGTYTVTLTVTDIDGGSATDTQVITVNANIAPTATIDTPSSAQTIQVGGTVNFTATSTDSDGNTPLSFVWDFNGGATNATVEDPGAVTFSTAGTYTVTFTVTDTLGASTSDTISIKVNAAPTAAIDTPSTATSIQIGSAVSFTGTGTDSDSSGGLTYAWNFGGGATNSSLEDPGGVTFSSIGTYTVTLTVTDSDGGSATDTETITVNAVPNIAPTAIIDTPNSAQSIEVGQSVSFMGTGTDSDSSGPLSYNWDFGGGAEGSAFEDPGAVIFSSLGTFTVTLTVTDSDGGSATDTETITVNAVPNIAPTAIIDTPNSAQSIEVGQSVSFTGTGSDSDSSGTLSYNWDFGGGATNTTLEDPGAIIFTTLGTFTVTFTVTDSDGGSATDTAIITVDLAANILPTATIDTPISAQSIQIGESISFSGTGSDSDSSGALTYSWGIDGAINSTEEDPGAVTFSNLGTFTVTFTVTDSDGGSASDTVTITVNAADNILPTATIDTPSSDQTIEVGESISFTGTGSDSGGNSELTYLWDFDEGAENSTQEDPESITFTEVGDYTVTFTVEDAQGGVSLPATVTITVGELTNKKQVLTTSLKSIAKTPNETAVSEVLASFCSQEDDESESGSDCADLVAAVQDDDPGATAEISKALAQITMDEVSASIDAISRSADISSNNINSRLATLRTGSRGVNLSGLNLNIQEQGVLQVGSLLDTYALQTGGGAGDDVEYGPWGIFLNGSVSVGEKDTTKKEAGYDFDTQGLTLGVDYRLNDNQVLGVALSYGMMENDLHKDGGEIEGSNYSLLFYGTQYADDYYMDVSLSFGRSCFDQHRNINYTLNENKVKQQLESDYNGGEFVMTVGGGYVFSQGALTFGPLARIEYMKFMVDAFKEDVVNQSSDGWAMSINKQSQEVLNTSISAQADYALSYAWGVLIPSAQFDWTHEFEGDNRVVNGSFVGDASNSEFKISTDVEDTDYFTLGLGVSTQLPHNQSAFFFYETLLGKSNTEQHSFSAGFRWGF